MTPSTRDRVFSLPCGDLKTLSRVICPWGKPNNKLKFPSGSNFFLKTKIPLREPIVKTKACVILSVSPRSSPMGTFRAEQRLRLSNRNSILMT